MENFSDTLTSGLQALLQLRRKKSKTRLLSNRNPFYLYGMKKLLIWIGISVGGWLGWWLGAKLGMGWAFSLSAAGSIAGVFVGWKIAQDHF